MLTRTLLTALLLLTPALAEAQCPAGTNNFAVRTSGSTEPFVCRTSTCRPIGARVSQTASAGWCIFGICYPARPAYSYEVAGQGPGQPAQYLCPAWLDGTLGR